MAVKRILALAVAMLGLAANPAAAQRGFPRINAGRIVSATIEQNDLTFTRPDVVNVVNGVVTPKPRTPREPRECSLDARAARMVAASLGRARRSPVEWKGIGGETTVIRFKGAHGRSGQLVAVLEGPGEHPGGEMRIFYAGLSAFLPVAEQEIVSRIVADAGCPL